MYRFGPFTADRTTYRVFNAGQPVDLTPKLLDLLFHLLDHPAALVTKEALLDAVWPGANVTDNALAQAVSDLREALGDVASDPTYIRTVARRGYRFVAPVELEAPLPAQGPGPRAQGSPAPGITPAPAPAAPDGRPTIVVLDFANVTGDPEVAWLGAGIAETVTSDLADFDRFRVVDRWRAAQAQRAGRSTPDVAAAVGATLVVAGSYQRSGPSLRITARLVDVGTGDALADVKVDGRLQDVFALQDGIGTAFARDLGIALPPRESRLGVRETASLDAYRAQTEGWLKLESLDTTLVPAAIADFQRAIAIDPRYATAYTGLANAEFVAYEMTRATTAPDAAALAAGIAHARHALALDDRLAEAHATLSFLLTSASAFDEARAAAARAVAIEPDNWRHQYRLGHALWGEARLRAMSRALAIYPRFAYAHFERIMVLVSRGDHDGAVAGIQHALQTLGSASSGDRFPAIAFHWLRGALHFARRHVDDARAEFEREMAQIDRRRLYGSEYAAIAHTAAGHVALARDDATGAVMAFDRALTEIVESPRALLGLAEAHRRAGDRPAEEAATGRFRQALDRLEAQGRHLEAAFVVACDAARRGALDEAAARLHRFLDAAPPSAIGWTIPIEPFFRPLHGHPEFAGVLSRLAERAG
jgi:DNA-binding winged helix-turn-helix (wHTH) protein/tetratricopeptide (TPR) repeat protein